MAKQKDIAASVRRRLLNLARQERRVFDVVLVAFGLERLIYRLSISDYRNRFILKGGMLVTLWTVDPGRFTRDVDFLAFGDDDEDTLKEAFTNIHRIDATTRLVDNLHTVVTRRGGTLCLPGGLHFRVPKTPTGLRVAR